MKIGKKEGSSPVMISQVSKITKEKLSQSRRRASSQ